MPAGGFVVFGSGLRLQKSSPGTQDFGNANISGAMIASQFTTSPNGLGVSNDNEYFGHGFTKGTGNRQVLVGNFLQTGTGFQLVCMGYNSTNLSNDSVAIGHTCVVGRVGDAGSWRVAMGHNCAAGLTAGSVSGTVAIGYLCSSELGANVALGANVRIATATVSDAACFAAGININLDNGGHRELVVLGKGITQNVGPRQNTLILGYYGGAISGALPTVYDSMVLIGNPNQTIVQIGAYTIGASSGRRALVADVNYNMASTDGPVLFQTITAPRTVTLPAAGSVQGGTIVRVVDMSGAASAVNTITTGPSGADTIVGSGSPVINTAYGSIRLMSDGVSKWNCRNDF